VVVQRVACELQALGPNLKHQTYIITSHGCHPLFPPFQQSAHDQALTRFRRKARISPTNLGAGFEGPFPAESFICSVFYMNNVSRTQIPHSVLTSAIPPLWSNISEQR
jgi:hypothetical protein